MGESGMSEHITFGVTSHEFTEVLRLDKDGMHYKGEVVKDAGEAHRIFMDVMKHIKEETDTYEKPWSPFRDPMVLFAVGICIGLAWGSTWAR
jgi:hypothetical protein